MQNLFIKYLDNQCSPAEIKELFTHFNNPESELILRSQLHAYLANDGVTMAETGNEFCAETDQSFIEIKKQMDADNATVNPYWRQHWLKFAAAALLLVGLLSVLKMVNNTDDPAGIVKTKTAEPEIVPGGDKAILTLADGSTIILDNAGNGDLTSQGNTKLIKLDGQLLYNSDASATGGEILYNSISTPRGGQYQVILADGTKVWLNAASALKFPTLFTGKERKVELTGEAYFEVSKMTAMPFVVTIAGKEMVEVLGTHFNINSYVDEATVKTTLLEGSVKVTTLTNLLSNTFETQILKSGQQANVNTKGNIEVQNNIDADDILAWKNGSFNFNSQDIKSIMRQVSRWYDVDISYSGVTSKETFSGIVSRKSNLSTVLKIMEQAGVHFKIEGKTIVVM